MSAEDELAEIREQIVREDEDPEFALWAEFERYMFFIDMVRESWLRRN